MVEGQQGGHCDWSRISGRREVRKMGLKGRVPRYSRAL